MTTYSSRALPFKVLLTLTAVVLLVHFTLLRSTSLSLGLNQAEPPRAFITRAIEPAAVMAQATTPPLALTPPRPRKAELQTRAPTPTPVVASASDLAPPPTLIEPESLSPTPVESVATANPIEADQAPTPPRVPRDQLAVAGLYTVPDSVRLQYKVDANKFPFGASAELQWQQNSQSYDARLTLSAFGQTRTQTSRGQVTPDGLAPIRFSDKFRSEMAAHFNRAQGKVTFSANTPDAPLLAGAQDRLSILVQLAAMLAGDPAHYPPATTISIQTIGARDADTWLFTVENAETLNLPGGQQATLKLVRNPRQEFDQKVELWMAPALGYLPARIRITEPNGDYIDQKWQATESQN